MRFYCIIVHQRACEHGWNERFLTHSRWISVGACLPCYGCQGVLSLFWMYLLFAILYSGGWGIRGIWLRFGRSTYYRSHLYCFVAFRWNTRFPQLSESVLSVCRVCVHFMLSSGDNWFWYRKSDHFSIFQLFDLSRTLLDVGTRRTMTRAILWSCSHDRARSFAVYVFHRYVASVLVAINSCDVPARSKRIFGVTVMIIAPQTRTSFIDCSNLL